MKRNAIYEQSVMFRAPIRYGSIIGQLLLVSGADVLPAVLCSSRRLHDCDGRFQCTGVCIQAANLDAFW